MKKIYSIFLTAIALLAFAPAVFAQHSINDEIKPTLEWPIENGVRQASDFAYSKDISAPQSDGTYWIKLESFSTGSSTFIEAAIPADIVLVLDLSSSMQQNFISTTDYHDWAPHHSAGYYWRYNDWNSNGNTVPDQDNENNYQFFYKLNDTYYQVHAGSTQDGRRTYYYMYFDANGSRYYLIGDGIEARTSYPDNVTSASGSIYTGKLWAKAESRLSALRRATCDFIDVIEKNDKYEDEAGTIPRKINGVETRLGNRISIITFWSEANLIVNLADGALKDQSSANATITTAQYLKNQVNAFENGSGTRPDLGIDKANIQLNDYFREESSKTVVVFTDGEPYPNTNNANYNTAIASAYTTKNTYSATVFTVGLFSSEATGTLRKFMNYMSSNAPKAQTISTSASDAQFTDETPGYFKDASGQSADLSAIFQEIAHQSAGTTTSLSAASANVDVISNSFQLPNGTDASNIASTVKIFVAKLNNIDVNGNYVFDTEVLKEYIPDTYTYYPIVNGVVSDTPQKVGTNPSISISLEGTRQIKVKGFDYGSCYCGPVYAQGYTPTGTWTTDRPHVLRYQGYKIIIMIPIRMNPDAVGGPNCPTNGTGSGIYINDGDQTAFVPYVSPTVSLPVNVYIEKKGLTGRESAKFMIEKALIPNKANWTVNDIDDNDWKYVSTVFVTNSPNAVKSADGYPMVRVKGMPATEVVGWANPNNPNDVINQATKPENDNVHTKPIQRGLVYRITEENWSWSYTPGTAPQYTITDRMDNPFTFDNTKKEHIDVDVRHAESKVTNIFDGTQDNKTYDDSKKNTGREQYYTPPTTTTSGGSN